jgi:DNA-binding XRE family transcriptional regulator
MKDQTVGNYLRTHRKRAGMSQRELGLLIGYKHEGQVSRHERSKTVPPLLTALAYQIIFRVPVSAMFPGFHSAVTQMVEGNLIDLGKTLQGRLEKDPNIKATAQTLRWLANRQAP